MFRDLTPNATQKLTFVKHNDYELLFTNVINNIRDRHHIRTITKNYTIFSKYANPLKPSR